MRSAQSKASRKDIKFGGIAIIDVDRDVCADPEYKVWVDMARRCSEEGRAKGNLSSYQGATLDAAWRNYSDFHTWVAGRIAQGVQIDKDIKMRNNRIYGPNACLLVDSRLNKAFQLKPAANGLPHGVKARPGNKFSASASDVHGVLRSRHFACPFEAHKFWQKSKAALLIDLVKHMPACCEVRIAVEFRAELLVSDSDSCILTGDWL